ncbi:MULTISPECIES: hypothetical protein [Nocardiaceae]|uniref:hypothetical protein n=1 Tax=Nocardiaceae TaxID=85025 RepID=UPI000B01F319|nr:MULTISPECIES: hypothetical protein [Rhodococcus]
MNARLAAMPDDAYVRPWPLHPQPLPGEALSSHRGLGHDTPCGHEMVRATLAGIQVSVA